MIGQRLEIRQGQGLVITPQLQQAIKLLQLSNLELNAFVEGELERNPLLQRDDGPEGGEPAGERADDHATDTARTDGEVELGEGGSDQAERAMDAGHDAFADATPGERMAEPSTGEAQPGLSDWSGVGRGGGGLPDDLGDDRADTREKSLWDHLHDQAAAAGFTTTERGVALALIDQVDDGGYLRGELAEIADRLGATVEQVEAVLHACQGFEPTGVMARSVPECLKLQLIERNRFDPAMACLLDNLEMLARRDYAGLKRACDVDEDDLLDMVAELKALTPRPGAAFGGEPAQTLIPDVHVRADPAGGWRIELNADTLPRLLVDRRYHAQVAGGARSDTEKAFVADCAAQANWLVKSLDQRARTILKVSSEIVRQQDAFLAFGIEFLRPLNLKTVADAIGMHESTVSRVTSGKYVATPRGVFELKFFFTAALGSTSGGAAHSAEAVRQRIKTMIDNEGRDGDVLSDDRIVDILKEAGVDIARRTVAKYREALRIPSSVERKRMLRRG